MKWYEEFYTNDYINMVGFAPDAQTHVERDFIPARPPHVYILQVKTVLNHFFS